MATSFGAFFRDVWGYDPFPWQEELARRVAKSGWPDVLDRGAALRDDAWAQRPQVPVLAAATVDQIGPIEALVPSLGLLDLLGEFPFPSRLRAYILIKSGPYSV